jgi:hypothetical protein
VRIPAALVPDRVHVARELEVADGDGRLAVRVNVELDRRCIDDAPAGAVRECEPLVRRERHARVPEQLRHRPRYPRDRVVVVQLHTAARVCFPMFVTFTLVVDAPEVNAVLPIPMMRSS